MKTLEEITLELYIKYLTNGDWAFEKEEAYKTALTEAKYFQQRMQKTMEKRNNRLAALHAEKGQHGGIISKIGGVNEH